MECALSMLAHSGLPLKFWAEAVVHAAHIRYFSPCPHDKTMSSYKAISGIKPRVEYLRTFRCLDWYHVPREIRKKIYPQSEPGVVVGFFENSQYKIWIPSCYKEAITRNVTIVESGFPGREMDEKAVLHNTHECSEWG